MGKNVVKTWFIVLFLVYGEMFPLDIAYRKRTDALKHLGAYYLLILVKNSQRIFYLQGA